jgi:hypothetical protein
LLNSISAGRTVPAEKISVVRSTESVVYLIPTGRTNEALLPEIDTNPVTTLCSSEIIERRVLTELFDNTPFVIDEPNESVVPAAIRVPFCF